MDSKAEGQRQTMLEKARRKIYEESERERQKIAKVTHCNKIVLDGSTYSFTAKRSTSRQRQVCHYQERH